MSETSSLFAERILRVDVKNDGIIDGLKESGFKKQVLNYLAEQQKSLSPEEFKLLVDAATSLLSRQEVERLDLVQELEKSKQGVRAQTRQEIGTLRKMANIGGALWDGWEKGVNGALDGTISLFQKTGTWIGETTAEAVHGKEGGLTDKLIKDTQWIRDGLDVTGKVLGETAEKIATGEGKEVLKTTTDYWKGKVDKIMKMTPEQIAYATGEGLAMIATAVVGAKGLDKASKIGILSKEISLGESALARGTGTVIQEGGQVGIELAGGNRTEKVKPSTKPNPHPSEVKISKTESRTGVSREKVFENAGLSPKERIRKAEEILRSLPEGHPGRLEPNEHLSKKQVAEMFGSHNAGKEVYNNGLSDLKQKVEEGKRAGKARAEKLTKRTGDANFAGEGFTKEQRKVLMENGVMGKPNANMQGIDINFREISAPEKIRLFESHFDLPRLNAECMNILSEGEKQEYIRSMLLKDARQLIGKTDKVSIELAENTANYLHIDRGTLFGEVPELSKELEKKITKLNDSLISGDSRIRLFSKSLEDMSTDEIVKNVSRISNTFDEVLDFISQNKDSILISDDLTKKYTKTLFELNHSTKEFLERIKGLESVPDYAMREIKESRKMIDQEINLFSSSIHQKPLHRFNSVTLK